MCMITAKRYLDFAMLNTNAPMHDAIYKGTGMFWKRAVRLYEYVGNQTDDDDVTS